LPRCWLTGKQGKEGYILRREAVLKALKQEIDKNSDLLYYGSEVLDAPVVAYLKNFETGEGCLLGCNNIDELEEQYNCNYYEFLENGLELVRLFVEGQEVRFSTRIKINVISTLE